MVVIGCCFSMSQSWPSILTKAFLLKIILVNNPGPRFESNICIVPHACNQCNFLVKYQIKDFCVRYCLLTGGRNNRIHWHQHISFMEHYKLYNFSHNLKCFLIKTFKLAYKGFRESLTKIVRSFSLCRRHEVTSAQVLICVLPHWQAFFNHKFCYITLQLLPQWQSIF